MEEEKRDYEVTLLIEPDITEEEARRKADELRDNITAAGGEFIASRDISRQRLAYPIKKFRQGYLASLVFSLEPSKLIQIEKKIKQEPRLMRYLLTHYEKIERVVPKRPMVTRTFPGMKPEVKEPMPSVEEIDKRLEEIIK